MNTRITTVILFILVFSSMALSQETACVFEFEAISVEQATAVAATQIFRNELQATGKFSIVPKGDMESALANKGITDYTCYGVTCAASMGRDVGVDYAIIGSLIKLGGKITAEVRLVNVISKDVAFSDRFSAISVDDLDSVLRKLARAVASREKIESEVGRFAITEEETMEQRRKQSYITSGASFGFGFPMGDSYGDISSLTNISWVMRYEAGNYVIDNSIGVSWGSSKPDSTIWGLYYDKQTVTIIPWDIGLRYIFSRESDFAPFIGGGLGIHFIGASEVGDETYIDGSQSMALHVAGGLYGFQSYDFRILIEAKYSMLFSDAFGPNSPSTQHMIGISLGISRKFEKGEKRGCMGGGCMF